MLGNRDNRGKESAEQYARLVLEHDLKSDPKPRRHISEVIRDNMRNVPPEILATMPSDGASAHAITSTACPRETRDGGLR